MDAERAVTVTGNNIEVLPGDLVKWWSSFRSSKQLGLVLTVEPETRKCTVMWADADGCGKVKEETPWGMIVVSR